MRRWLVGIVVVGLLASACTKAKTDTSPSPSAGSPDGSPSAATVVKGTYGWDAYGVTATLKPGDGAWSLEIKNTSGAKIDKPGIYALGQMDGHQVDATVAGSKPLGDGDLETFDVTWPPEFDPKNAGMIMLTVGNDLYGGFQQG